MKTGNESLQKSTPLSFIKKVTRWPYKLQKKVKSYLSTETGLSFLFALISVVAVTLILSNRYLTADNLLKSEFSSRDVYADKVFQIEDTEETQRSRYEAKQSIAPIYKIQVGMDKVIIDRLVNLLRQIEEVRTNVDLAPELKAETVRDLLHLRKDSSEEEIATLLESPRWMRIYEKAVQTMETLVSRGIRSEDFRSKKELLIRQALQTGNVLSKEEIDAIVILVGVELRPTLLIDEKSTEEARSIAASHIKPVIQAFNKGELIVQKGERITELQRAALQKQGHLVDKNRWLSIIGVAILSISLLTIVWGYLYRFEHSNFFKPAYAGLIAMLIIASVGGFALLIDLNPTLVVEVFPISIISLMICIFTHPRIAILTTMMVLLLCGLALRIPLESLATPVISSMVGIFLLAKIPVPHDRNDLILAGLGVGISRAVVILATSFIYDPVLEIEQLGLFFRIWLGILAGIFSGILTLGLMPIVESCFKLVTPYTLLELGNHDRPLLKRMQMEAPGTFHHSLMVATLAEAAAEAIGANPILTRVGALYHDIGKMKRPLFFVENQTYFGVENPHDKLTPRLSKMVITAHPRDGIELARQWGLPKVIKKLMAEHHGTLIAGFFYNKAVLEEGEENVNKAQFRYPGPKPQSKESAVIMLADASESAVRALKNPTITQVEERVSQVIKQRVDDNQFSECPLTFQDIHTIRETFIRILKGIQHYRVEYQQSVLEELGKKSPPAGSQTAKAAPENRGSSNGSETASKSEPPEDSLSKPNHPKAATKAEAP